MYKIPKTTLYDRISGKVLHGSKPGPKPYFSPTEEREMANFLIDVAKAGYGKTRKEVQQIAGMAAHDKGRIANCQVSRGWFKRFLQRQPQLSYCRGDHPTANVRMDCLNRDAMTQYFDLLIEDLLKEVLTENNQMNSPGRICNVDVIGGHGSIDQTSVMDSTSNHTSSMDSSSDHVLVTSSSSDHMSVMDSNYCSDHASVMSSSSDRTSLIDSSSDHTSLMDSSSDHTSLIDGSSDHTSLMDSSSDHTSLMDSSSDHTSLMGTVLSDVSIATPVAVVSGSNDASSVVEHHSEGLSALQQRESRPNVKGCEGNASTVHVSKVSKPNAVENGESRYISNYLVQFVPDAKSQKKEEVVRAPVLTSDKCAAILKEHEEKKPKEKEEKQRRKLMREQKKKEREEEQRKRKAAAAKKRAAVAEKATIEAEKKAAAEAKKAAAEARKAAAAVGDELKSKRQATSYTARAKQPRLFTDADIPFSSVDENECCVCFSMHSEDEDWVQCGCNRWLHEGCITEVIIDVSGKELFCPFCAFDMHVRSLISCM